MDPEFRTYAEAELTLRRERYQTRAERFRAAAAEAHTSWRLGCIRRPDGAATAIIHEGIAYIVRLRLLIAYMPLLQGLERIKARVTVLSDLKRERWAHPDHPSNRK